MNLPRVWPVAVWMSCFSIPAASGQEEGGEMYVAADFTQPQLSVMPGKTFMAMLQLDIADGWHIGWRYPGLIGLPTKIALALPPDVELVDQRWSLPHYLDAGQFESSWVYTQQAAIQLLLRASGRFSGRHPLHATVDYLVCAEVCLNGQLSATTELMKDVSIPGGKNSQGAFTFEQPVTEVKTPVRLKRVGEVLQIELARIPSSAAVEVFAAPDAVRGFSQSSVSGALRLGLKLGPAYRSDSDILLVIRPDGQPARGIRLSPEALTR